MKPTKNNLRAFRPAQTKKKNAAAKKPVVSAKAIAKPVISKPREVARPSRAAQALYRLGVSQIALDAAPRITPMLKRAAAGGIRQVIDAMRLSQDETVRAFLLRYDGVPQDDREHVSVEAIALSAGIDVAALLGPMILALQAQSATEVKITVLTGHPKIAAARIKFGLLPSGVKDRDAVDTALGLLPSPKGPTFIGKAIFGSGQNAMNEQRALPAGGRDEDEDETAPEDIDLEKLFPPANAMQERLQSIRQRSRLAEEDDEASNWHKRGL